MTSPTLTLTDETAERIERIVGLDIIGGQQSSIGLHDRYVDAKPLANREFMAEYLNGLLADRGSALRVVIMEQYWFPAPNLGPICYFGLTNPARTEERPRIFTFGRYNPAFEWSEYADPQTLARNKRYHDDNLNEKRLSAAAKAEVAVLAARVQAIVKARQVENPPTADQLRLVKLRTDYTSGLDTLEPWAYVCQVLGYNFAAILAEACQATID